MPHGCGFVEFALLPLTSLDRAFSNQELRVIDEASRPEYFRNTIGSVNDIVDGIEFLTDSTRMIAWPHPHRIGDYWRLMRDGRYYCARLMEENYLEKKILSHSNHPPLWIDTTVFRIKEFA